VSKSNFFANSILAFLFNGVNIPGLSNELSIALHTTEPKTDDQTPKETTYKDYTRLVVNRTPGGWRVKGNGVSPDADINFPECTGSPGSPITHFSILASGRILYFGPVIPNIIMAVGVSPRLKSDTTIIQEF
jgi:hypothetical protein